MSRIGNKAITIPAGVEGTVAGGTGETLKRPKGPRPRQVSASLGSSGDDGICHVTRPNDEKHTKQLHGTTRALLHNMVVGVSEGFKKELQLVGIGFRSQVSGKKLVLNIGYSHPVEFEIVEGIDVKCNSATEIEISGIDKQLVGEFAANVRASRKPEPYKGKGVRYKDEHVRRKEGKTAGKK